MQIHWVARPITILWHLESLLELAEMQPQHVWPEARYVLQLRQTGRETRIP